MSFFRYMEKSITPTCKETKNIHEYVSMRNKTYILKREKNVLKRGKSGLV